MGRNNNIFDVKSGTCTRSSGMDGNGNLFDVNANNKEVFMNRNEETTNKTTEPDGAAFLGSLFLIGTVILILGYAYIHWFSPKTVAVPVPVKAGQAENAQVRNEPETVYNAVLLRQQINRLAMDYQNDCNRLLVQFLELLENNVNPDFDRAKRSIPDVVDQLSGIGACTKLSYKAAKDKLKGTHDFEDAYMDVMNGPIVQPCLHANAVASDMLQDLNQRLKERHTQYAMDLAAACGDDTNPVPAPDLERLQMCINTTAATSRKLQQEKMFALVGAAFEVIFIRTTYKAVVALFAKPVAKICGSLGIGGICVAADGPIPVGDIVGGVLAIGGFAWTAYDIYDVTCKMPEKLKSELRSGLDETRDSLLSDSRTKARELVNTYQTAGSTLKSELIRQI